MQSFSFIAGLELVASHGMITNPVSRNELVCKKVYGDDLMGAAFTCTTDRETPAQSPWFSGLPAGVPAGDMPGVAKVYEPFCSGGTDSRISADAIAGLNARGPSQATWDAGSTVSICWSVQAAHGGVFGYRLCCDGTNSEECFQRHPLLTEDGQQWIKMTSDVQMTTDWCTNHQVPSDVAGQCTVSWRWDGGCTDCASGQTSESSVFTSCSDVTVTSSSPTPSPTPSPKPAPPTPAPSPKPVDLVCGYTACADDEVCCCNGAKAVYYCVAGDSSASACSGSTRCPTSQNCCGQHRTGFLSTL